MQFFPSDIFSTPSGLPTGQLGGAINSAGQFAQAASKTNTGFKDILDTVSAYNEANTTGVVPLTTASTRDKTSYFNSEDFKVLKSKLNGLGVAEEIIDEYFAYMAAAKPNPTIGTLCGSVADLINDSQLTGLSKQEFVQFNDMLTKLGFDNGEIKDIKNMIHNGEGHSILKKIKEKLGVMKQEGKDTEISLADFDVLLKACNIHSDMRKPIMGVLEAFKLGGGDVFKLDTESFDKLFATTMAKLELRQLNLQDLHNNMGEAIEAMLAAKKERPEEAVSDMRGSALSARSETMSKVLATLINEEDEEEESSTSHLIDNKAEGKTSNKESIAATLADDKMTPKAVKENREADTKAGIRGENSVFAAAATKGEAQVKAENMTTENHDRPNANIPLREQAASDGKPNGNFFSGQQQNGAETNAGKAALSSKVQEAPGVVFSLFSQMENSSASNQATQTAKAEMYQERIFEQVERGIIKNASDGSKQIVIRLDPPELGKLTLSLSVAQGEVKALIRTESAATTQVVSEQLTQLKKSLEEQGFKVSSLEVETRTQSHAGTDHWSGAKQHNQEQQLLEQSRFLRLARTRAKEADTLAQSMQLVEHPASISASGLHVIA